MSLFESVNAYVEKVEAELKLKNEVHSIELNTINDLTLKLKTTTDKLNVTNDKYNQLVGNYNLLLNEFAKMKLMLDNLK